MIDDINDDIDALIDELNATGADGVRPGARTLQLQPLLAAVARRRGSDLLLVAGSAPGIRIDGAVVQTRRCASPSRVTGRRSSASPARLRV